jgi:retron-type reverse transcriptase
MKRQGKLWSRVCSFSNLVAAHRKARRGKRSRPDVAAFELDLEANLLGLLEELRSGSYRPGECRTFRICDPKPRTIAASLYRDRVVHHALLNVLEPMFDRRMVPDSYACRKGKGTHKALDRFTFFARRHAVLWHGDIVRFFPSIRHDALRALLRRILKDDRVLRLCDDIIDAGAKPEPVPGLLPRDGFLPLAFPSRGLPIGSLTSQWFANLYLDPFDRFVKERLRVPAYVRYCDDFVLFGNSRRQVETWRDESVRFLREFGLAVHENRLQVHRTARGDRFLGFRVFPDRRLLVRENARRARKRIRRLVARARRGMVPWRAVRASVVSWIAHAAHGDTWRLRAGVLSSL